MFGAILSAVPAGFDFGGLARLAVPGPDPMPFTLTVTDRSRRLRRRRGHRVGDLGSSHVFDTSGRGS